MIVCESFPMFTKEPSQMRVILLDESLSDWQDTCV